jgi:tripartite ATP-independent transporter DctM subunit
VRCFFQPHLGPPLPPQERVSWAEKLRSLRAVIYPILLIVGVLGSLFAGLATATESAAVGSFGSIICAILNRRFSWKNLKSASYSTLLLVCMILWIMISVSCFTNVFIAVGGSKFVTKTILGLGLNRWIILWGMQFVWFILGCLIDPTGILMITIPVFVPIIKELGFNSLWFGVLFVVNMELSFLTPPFGFNLFYLRNLLSDTPMEVIYSSVWPFIILQAIGLAIVIIFPQSVLWLPNLILGK